MTGKWERGGKERPPPTVTPSLPVGEGRGIECLRINLSDVDLTYWRLASLAVRECEAEFRICKSRYRPAGVTCRPVSVTLICASCGDIQRDKLGVDAFRHSRSALRQKSRDFVLRA